MLFFFFQAEDGIRDVAVTGVQTCALPISAWDMPSSSRASLRNFPGWTGSKLFLMVTSEVSTSAAREASAPGCSKSTRSEEHTSELQSRLHLVCRLLLEKKNTWFLTIIR